MRAVAHSRFPKLLFLLLAVSAAVRFSYDYPRLPEVVECHFDAAGKANLWQTKPVFFAFFVGSIVLSSFFTFALPALLRSLPSELFNLPGKQYWLSAERRESALEFLSAWFGCAVFVVAGHAFHYTIERNLHADSPPAATQFVLVLAAFGVFLALVDLAPLPALSARSPESLGPGYFSARARASTPFSILSSCLA